MSAPTTTLARRALRTLLWLLGAAATLLAFVGLGALSVLLGTGNGSNKP